MDNNIKKSTAEIKNGVNRKNSFNFKDVHVYTMPKGFKKPSEQASDGGDSARKTGFLILTIGSLFLIASLVAAYYFFVMKPADEKISVVENIVEEESGETKQVESKKNTEDVKAESQQPVVVDSKKEEVNTANDLEKDLSLGEDVLADIDSAQNKDVTEADFASSSQTQQIPRSIVIDRDQDGLSQEEEMAVGTSDNSLDTDGDTYSDLAEMLNGYNPVGDGKISNNPNFTIFKNSKYNFSFYYPELFSISANTDETIIFDLGDEEFFQIFVEPNQDGLDIEAWYKKQFNIDIITDATFLVNGDWKYYQNSDSGTIFFKNNNNNYVIAFNYSRKSGDRYINIFEIIFKTFQSSI